MVISKRKSPSYQPKTWFLKRLKKEKILWEQYRREHEKKLNMQVSAKYIRVVSTTKKFYGLIASCKTNKDIVNSVDMEWPECADIDKIWMKTRLAKGGLRQLVTREDNAIDPIRRIK